MTDLKVQPETPASEKVTTCGAIAADLRRVADSLDAVSDLEVQVDPYVTLGIQPGGTDQQIATRTDTIGRALFGMPGAPQRMGGSTWHYKVAGRVGLVRLDVYDAISDPEASRRDAELERLRAEVESLRSLTAGELTGLGYSRDADDPTPVSPARVPLHTGAMVDGGQLVDETEPVTRAAITEACVITGWGQLCTTHKARHIATSMAECGCPVFPFAGRGDAADTIVDHRLGCPTRASD